MQFLQDDVHIMIPLVGPQKQALSNAERTTAFAALVFTMIQYPFATQEIVVDSKSAVFQAPPIIVLQHQAGSWCHTHSLICSWHVFATIDHPFTKQAQ